MTPSFKSLVLAVCLLACQASAQVTPAPSVTPPVNASVTSAPVTSAPAASVPAASAPAASAPAASAPAASAPAASAPAATAPAATPSVTGWFSSWFRPVVTGGAAAANSGISLVNDTVQFKTSLANRLGQGLLGTVSSLSNMGIGLASDGITFGTGAVSRIAGIGEGLANAVPFRPIGAAATFGANLFRLGANMTSLGGNMALTAAQTVSTAKTNILSSGLNSGTKMVANAGSGALAAAQTGVNVGAQMANQLLTSADSMIAAGTKMMNDGMAMMNGYVGQAGSTAQGMADRAKEIVDANLAAALPGATAPAASG